MSINRRRGRHLRHPLAAAVLLSVLSEAPTHEQAVLDCPLILEARPATLVTGSGAVLANPSGIADLAERAEALVSDLETPDEMGLRALTVAGTLRLLDHWTIAAAYRHIGVGDMLRTDGPPLGETPRSLEIGEDVFALGLGVRLATFRVGLAGRLDTPAGELRGDEVWAGTLGASWVPELAGGTLRLATALEVETDEATLAGAAEAGAPLLLEDRLALAIAWGVRQNGPLGVSHTVVGSGVWRGVAELQAGASAQPGAGGAQWVPLFAGLLHLGRYRLGIVREHLPNDFGAAMHYRLSVAF